MRFETFTETEVKQEWTDGHSLNGELQICVSLFSFIAGTGLDWNLPTY